MIKPEETSGLYYYLGIKLRFQFSSSYISFFVLRIYFPAIPPSHPKIVYIIFVTHAHHRLTLENLT